MVGFRITVNGNAYFESDDISALTMVAEMVARRSGYRISLHAGSGDAPVQWRQLPVGASIRGDSEWRCGFCSNQPANGGGLVVRNGAAVCPECLRTCSDILSESANR